jgi:hypothetical protein
MKKNMKFVSATSLIDFLRKINKKLPFTPVRKRKFKPPLLTMKMIFSRGRIFTEKMPAILQISTSVE